MWHPDTPIEYQNNIVTGDARQLSERIPDESVDLIFTDPVYDRMEDYEWLAQVAGRVLKPGGALLAFCGIGWLEDTLAALRRGGMPVRWPLPIYMPGQTQRIHPRVFNHWQCLLWAGGDPVNAFVDLQVSLTSTLEGTHRWRKNPAVLRKYLQAFSAGGDVVLDLFAGGGGILATCKMLGRDYIAFELDPATAQGTNLRLQMTQPPLFVQEPEQAALDLCQI